MVEIVFALLLLQDHKIIEHRYQNSTQLFQSQAYAMKDKGAKDRVTYQCLKSKNKRDIHGGEKNYLINS